MKNIEPQILKRVDARLRADLEAARPRPSGDLHARILAAIADAGPRSARRRWLRPAAIAAGVLALIAAGISVDRGRADAARAPALPDWTALFELPALEMKLRLDDPLMSELRLLARDTTRATQRLMRSLPAPLRPNGN